MTSCANTSQTSLPLTILSAAGSCHTNSFVNSLSYITKLGVVGYRLEQDSGTYTLGKFIVGVSTSAEGLVDVVNVSAANDCFGLSLPITDFAEFGRPIRYLSAIRALSHISSEDNGCTGPSLSSII